MSSFFVSYRRRFNLDEVLREWAAEQVATNRDQRDPRRSGEDITAAPDGAAEDDEVRPERTYVTLQTLVLCCQQLDISQTRKSICQRLFLAAKHFQYFNITTTSELQDSRGVCV